MFLLYNLNIMAAIKKTLRRTPEGYMVTYIRDTDEPGKHGYTYGYRDHPEDVDDLTRTLLQTAEADPNTSMGVLIAAFMRGTSIELPVKTQPRPFSLKENIELFKKVDLFQPLVVRALLAELPSTE